MRGLYLYVYRINIYPPLLIYINEFRMADWLIGQKNWMIEELNMQEHRFNNSYKVHFKYDLIKSEPYKI